ncbi:unnamed protein product, partial [Mesorhabditis spiculigera]
MIFVVDLRDDENRSHRSVKCKFEAQATVKCLRDVILSRFVIALDFQEIFDSSDRRIDWLIGPLENTGLRDGDILILKHAELLCWTLYKDCVDIVLKQRWDKAEKANEAVELHERLTISGFFDVYVEFNNFVIQNHTKVAAWTDGDVGLIRKATEQYFRNLQDQNRGNEDSKFVCYFEERDADLEGCSTSTLAFVQIHGEDSVSKYNVKFHHYGPKGGRLGQRPYVAEFYCYKLLALIGVGPKSHIIPPSMATGTETSPYIATKWNDSFELLENLTDENSLCVDVVVQLVMLRVLLYISDLHERNCGRWKGTEHAAIVDFAPRDNVMIYTNIKNELARTFPDGRWRKQYYAVKNQHDDNSWLKIAKVYFDKWDLSNKIELAREELYPTEDLLKGLEIGVKKWQCQDSPTEELNEYIDTLRKNLEQLQTLLNSIA